VRKANEHVLLLDAGDSLYGDYTPAKTTQGASSVQVMNMLEYDAMAVGGGDLRIGTEIEKRLAEANFSILSANTYVWGSDELLALPYVLKQIAGHNVAIVGLSEPFTRTDYFATDPIPAVEAVVTELASQAGVIIGLSHAGPEIDAQIASQVSGSDVIVSGGTSPASTPTQDPTSGTVLFHAESPSPGYAGMYMGQGTLYFDRQGTLIDFEWVRIVIEEEIAPDPDVAQWVADNP